MKKTIQDKTIKTGLRERKKTKVRLLLQHHALQLFRERGYYNTTVEQIAEAAEVSPSTFFRYFPTKEDLVVYDMLDPLFLEALKAQPAELKPIQVIRNALHEIFSQLRPEELAELREREKLMRSVPELRTKMLDESLPSVRLIMQLVAGRVGRPADDIAVRTFVGAVMGTLASVWFTTAEPWTRDLLEQVDIALRQLENCLPL